MIKAAWTSIAMLFSINTWAQSECDLRDPVFVSTFFYNKDKWLGVSSNGTIQAKINFSEPSRSSFKVDKKSALISNLKLKNCEEIRFSIKHEGAKYNAKLWRDVGDQLVVSISVPPLLVYRFPLKSL